nr:ATP-grasp domain-containing protein [Zhongshania antarctica]
MSSSGKGQSLVRRPAEVDDSLIHAQESGRAGAGRVIVEGFVDFDYEITQLAIGHRGADGEDTATSFCAPIGHLQKKRRLSRVVAAASYA